MAAGERAGVTTVDALLAAYPEPQQTIVRRLRDVMAEVAPELEQSVKWGVPVYRRGRDNLFSFVPHRQHVNLQIFNGAVLDDRRRLLEGTGKSLRHVKLRQPADVEREGLKQLLTHAISGARPDKV